MISSQHVRVDSIRRQDNHSQPYHQQDPCIALLPFLSSLDTSLMLSLFPIQDSEFPWLDPPIHKDNANKRHQVEAVLESLLNEPISVAALENVYGVLEQHPDTKDLPLPLLASLLGWFLQSINAVRDIEGRPSQTRLVKLLCALVQVMLDRVPLAVEPLIDELRSLCLEHSGIAAAVDLYKRLV